MVGVSRVGSATILVTHTTTNKPYFKESFYHYYSYRMQFLAI